MKTQKNMVMMMNKVVVTAIAIEKIAMTRMEQTKNPTIFGNINRKMYHSLTMRRTLVFCRRNLMDTHVSKTASQFNANMMQLKVTK